MSAGRIAACRAGPGDSSPFRMMFDDEKLGDDTPAIMSGPSHQYCRLATSKPMPRPRNTPKVARRPRLDITFLATFYSTAGHFECQRCLLCYRDFRAALMLSAAAITSCRSAMPRPPIDVAAILEIELRHYARAASISRRFHELAARYGLGRRFAISLTLMLNMTLLSRWSYGQLLRGESIFCYSNTMRIRRDDHLITTLARRCCHLSAFCQLLLALD